MPSTNADLHVTEASWKKLKTLRASQIDLSRLALIREKDRTLLSDARELEKLLLELGLNDEGLEEYPESLYPYCGKGLRIWQYPIQFSRYLVDISRLGMRSYLELGVRHGGTFVATVEYLDKFQPLDFAIAVDIMPCPSMAEYEQMNPKARFVRLNTQSVQYQYFLDQQGMFGLVLVDSFHEEEQCYAEFASVKKSAQAIAIHDIVNRDFPGVARVWERIKASGEFECREYVEQYADVEGPYMGIGLAIRKETI
jgi:cephalosporin hydroxylase